MTGIEKLRALARRKNFLEPAEAREIDAIADQIERETEERSARLYDERLGEETDVCELFGVEPVDDPLTSLRRHVESLNDTIENLRLELGEARDDAAWVREHGGLGAVKRRWECLSFYAEPVPRSYAERRIASRQRQIDESHAALRRRNERIVELEHERDELREMVRSLNALTDEMEKRLMPEGMEWLVEAWPRFEDDAPVRFLDDFERYGDENGVSAVTMYSDGSFALNCRAYSKGEHVNRPAPKVLDSEGVECNVGDAVWWVRNKAGDFRIVRIESDGKCAIHDDDEDEPCGMTVPSTELTHVRPVLDADGAEIEVGDDLYSVEGMLKFHVSAIDKKSGRIATEAMFALDKWADPSLFTHRSPVLAADGKPLREGETVWSVKDGTEYRVGEIRDTTDDDDEPCKIIGCSNDELHIYCAYFPPDKLTHERPDSWERLEEDAESLRQTIAAQLGDYDFDESGKDSVQTRLMGLVRRAKALAERDA